MLVIFFKFWIEEGFYGDDVIVGIEMNYIRFIKFVYLDDELYIIVKVFDKQLKRNELGIFIVLLFIYNYKEEKVFEGELLVLMK